MQFLQHYVEHNGFEVGGGACLFADFLRLAEQMNWTKQQTKQKRIEFAEEILEHIGEQMTRLESLQRLIMRYKPHLDVPCSITQCRALIARVMFINVFDLVSEEHLHSNDLTQFDSIAELAAYIKKTGKVCPREQAKEQLVTKVLLRQLWKA